MVIDLVATLLLEGFEKLEWAEASYEAEAWADAIYHTYAVFVSSAKALLLDKGVSSSTQIGVIREFDTNYVETGEITLPSSFNELVLQINKNEPTEEFATAYLASVTDFIDQIKIKKGI